MRACFYKAILIFICVVFGSGVKAQGTEFFPIKGHRVLLEIQGVTILVKENGRPDKVIELDAEKKIHIEISDYNFDGVKDFSVWHMDDGMGVYKMYRVFVFDIKTEGFLEIFPDCGDEFINLKVNNVLRYLISTYFEGGEPKSCMSFVRGVK